MVYLNPEDPYEEALIALETAQEHESHNWVNALNQRALVFATLANTKAQLQVAEELKKLRETVAEEASRNRRTPRL